MKLAAVDVERVYDPGAQEVVIAVSGTGVERMRVFPVRVRTSPITCHF